MEQSLHEAYCQGVLSFSPFWELVIVTSRLEVVHTAGLAEGKSEQVQRTR